MAHSFSKTDIGRKRQLNQDFVYTSDEAVGNLKNLYIVADGMGGHNAGDFASSFTVETVVKEIRDNTEPKPFRILGKAIRIANELIRLLIPQSPKGDLMPPTWHEVPYLIPKNTTMLKMSAKTLTRCILHTIFEFIRGLLGKRPSHFFW